MLASFFVVNGAKAIAKPEDYTAEAEPVADKLVPLVQKAAPAAVSGYIPSDTRSLVRASGAAQVIGGLSLATGLGRRLGAGILALTQVPQVLSTITNRPTDPQDKSHQRSLLVRNVALLGATMIAAGDTEGKPSLGWRANQAGRQLSHSAEKQSKKLSRAAEKRSKQLSKESKKAAKRAKKAIEGVTE